jgi:phenylalanyl-tRNA synthetase alpha chain
MALSALFDYRARALSALEAVEDEGALEAWKVAHLAGNGELAQWKRGIGKLEPAARKAYGAGVHEVTRTLEEAFTEKRGVVEAKALAASLSAERVDLSLPTRHRRHGALHPLTRTLREIVSAFQSMGFMVFESPDVETDEFNFQLLNIPPHHPARDMQDTFYVELDGRESEGAGGRVLRTHTSAGQIRAMRALGPGPLRVILPGICYRNEDITTRSEMQFHQIEGLLVGENVRMSDLKGILLQFARLIFGGDQAVRLRGSYFPFTEPSVEVDVRCALCGGTGCRVCKYSGWLELLGAGLVHPVVLANGGYDPSVYRGIAFGIGLPRLAMLRHGVDDIRHFHRNDLRFLRHFA